MSAATWEEVKRKAAEKRAANAPAPEPEPVEEPEAPPAPPTALRTGLPRQYGNGRTSLASKLAIGQAEERRFRVEGIPPGRKAKFVKICSSVHVQCRGPIVLVKDRDESARTQSGLPWSVFRLFGDERFSWGESLQTVLQVLAINAEELSNGHPSFKAAKRDARVRIAEANGELGS